MTEIMDWFQSNLLTLNFNKTTFLQFLTKQNKAIKIQINASNSISTNITSTKFLGLTIDNTLSWNDHIALITSKLNKASYAIRAVKSYLSSDVLRTIYFSYVHSLILYGIIFWGNSHSSTNIFKIKKRIIRILTHTGRQDLCRPLFKQLQILPLPSQYIFSILLFVNKNRDLYLYNSEIYKINTRYNQNLHLPSTNLTLVQKGVLYSGSKIYNCLPLSIKAHSNKAKCFKVALKRYLIEHVFYSLDEYFQI